ncbi:B12-binding domain-containing radical SAM protein [Brevibacillus agri]|uniref:B12-binding domain-containing radical SAM protein n=1 Tax=Brevibacillus agri TaxID=51101 RepID=A0A3M8A8I3_9BACL|nr:MULTISPECIES: B12-binding domain-containing radical SAM protein [Brevibacillus]MBY0052756.1 B12-binding domain-containing radical SAM protein [Brevibacillus agri]MDN4093263.1 B12-binding domain-containing radical SAM protein [Brevibacillus agri]QAV14985.1 B12-binding domain-containing radical SAM protein [Brevibacillus agri]QHZ57650.1 B12-binding domain-containing radical SAM protein [Brevibacillus sp. NSP2.1]RNB47569.1 B12-binding domain-containing radical SAM protein [Brevibacillus agri]
MKIVLSTLNAKFIHSSLALRYLRSYAQKAFPGIELVEYTINDVTLNIVADIYKRQPDIVAFSCYIWNIRETLDVIRNLKKVCPDVAVILGGPEVTYDADEWMKKHPEIDVIAIGEGEQTFLELLQAYQEAKAEGKPPRLRDVAGIAYRDDEYVRFSAPRAQIEEMDTIPSPYADHLDELNNRVVYFEASRGCPFKCQYCLSSIEDGVRYFSLERVKEDLLRLIRHGVKTIKFVDRTFNINKKYAMEIFQFLIDNHNGTVFQFEITADILRADVLDFLTENAPPGIFRFEIGVQSTNDETNRLVQRIQRFDRLARTVTQIKESGKIDQHLDLIAGLPEEDYQSFRKTFNDVFALRPEELQLGFLKMLRGTGVRARAANHGYVFMDEAPYEILGNNVLSFADMQKIKRVEDVLEKYWNAHRMDLTLEWLLANQFETPFDFFQTFGDYWEQQGWSRIGHQLEDLFLRLQAFLQHENVEGLRHVQSLMKFDYLRNQKHRPRKLWWEDVLDKEAMQKTYAAIYEQRDRLREDFAAHAALEKDYFKHTVTAKVTFDIETWLRTGEVIEGDFTLVVYYPYKKEDKNDFAVVNQEVHAAG